jgi:hypothetical protein
VDCGIVAFEPLSQIVNIYSKHVNGLNVAGLGTRSTAIAVRCVRCGCLSEVNL